MTDLKTFAQMVLVATVDCSGIESLFSSLIFQNNSMEPFEIESGKSAKHLHQFAVRCSVEEFLFAFLYHIADENVNCSLNCRQ